MNPNGYAYQLRTLRAAERAQNKDYTSQALEVYSLRLASIAQSGESDEAQERARASAYRQWATFMQRDMPANG